MSPEIRIDGTSDRPIGEVITKRGKALAVNDTVGDARRLLANDSVRVVPVLDGPRYVGAIDREAISEAPPSATVGSIASPLLPTATAATPTGDALAVLESRGGSRLVVLDGDDATYVGLVCLRSDGERLCIDAECHPPPAI